MLLNRVFQPLILESALLDRKMGTSNLRAFSKASSPQGYQSTCTKSTSCQFNNCTRCDPRTVRNPLAGREMKQTIVSTGCLLAGVRIYRKKNWQYIWTTYPTKFSGTTRQNQCIRRIELRSSMKWVRDCKVLGGIPRRGAEAGGKVEGGIAH
jgi:hypothetical protein